MEKKVSPSQIGISEGQYAKFTDMLWQGVLKSFAFRSLPREMIEGFIKHFGSAWRNHLVEILALKLDDFASTFTVKPGCSRPQILIEAFETGGFVKIPDSMSLANVPFSVNLGFEIEVHEVRHIRAEYYHELPGMLIERGVSVGFKNGFKFVEPLTAVLFATTHPERMAEVSLVSCFIDVYGELCQISLREKAGRRTFRIVRIGHYDRWNQDNVILAMPRNILGL